MSVTVLDTHGASWSRKAMELTSYMRLANLKDEHFARLVGVDRSMVSRWRRGVTIPDWKNIARISQATDGAVSADDFLPMKEVSQ